MPPLNFLNLLLLQLSTVFVLTTSTHGNDAPLPHDRTLQQTLCSHSIDPSTPELVYLKILTHLKTLLLFETWNQMLENILNSSNPINPIEFPTAAMIGYHSQINALLELPELDWSFIQKEVPRLQEENEKRKAEKTENKKKTQIVPIISLKMEIKDAPEIKNFERWKPSPIEIKEEPHLVYISRRGSLIAVSLISGKVREVAQPGYRVNTQATVFEHQGKPYAILGVVNHMGQFIKCIDLETGEVKQTWLTKTIEAPPLRVSDSDDGMPRFIARARSVNIELTFGLDEIKPLNGYSYPYKMEEFIQFVTSSDGEEYVLVRMSHSGRWDRHWVLSYPDFDLVSEIKYPSEHEVLRLLCYIPPYLYREEDGTVQVRIGNNNYPLTQDRTLSSSDIIGKMLRNPEGTTYKGRRLMLNLKKGARGPFVEVRDKDSGEILGGMLTSNTSKEQQRTQFVTIGDEPYFFFTSGTEFQDLGYGFNLFLLVHALDPSTRLLFAPNTHYSNHMIVPTTDGPVVVTYDDVMEDKAIRIYSLSSSTSTLR